MMVDVFSYHRFAYILVGLGMVIGGLYGLVLWQAASLPVLVNLYALWLGGLYVLWLSCDVDEDGTVANRRSTYIRRGNRLLMYVVGFLVAFVILFSTIDLSLSVGLVPVGGLLYLYAGPSLVFLYRWQVMPDGWTAVGDAVMLLVTPFVFVMMAGVALFHYVVAFTLAD